jgi:hypothetical protein
MRNLEFELHQRPQPRPVEGGTRIRLAAGRNVTVADDAVGREVRVAAAKHGDHPGEHCILR